MLATRQLSGALKQGMRLSASRFYVAAALQVILAAWPTMAAGANFY
jgi:hypothetical protein